MSALPPEFVDFCWTRTPLGDIKAKSKGGSNGKGLWTEQKTNPVPELEWGLEKAEGKQECVAAAEGALQQLLLGVKAYFWSGVTEWLKSVQVTHAPEPNVDL